MCLFSSHNPNTVKILLKSWYAKLFNSFQAIQSTMYHKYGSEWTRVTSPIKKNCIWPKVALVMLCWICHPNLEAPATHPEPFQTSLGPQMTLSNKASEQSLERKKKTFLKSLTNPTAFWNACWKEPGSLQPASIGLQHKSVRVHYFSF